ncbi:phosphoribulokinase [Leptolyngbya sp. FACHB-261]|uniref:phosphoribulokinase n=1 Tax=Leptolyngbya sp. FACHB-261 TaxID=2692806 RepID=UPI0016825F16|nr:phosphoribulokinase [Leptolyngbya sp. FACHB-261]MBD2100856.1 phosphoribulokinase [Leptolyngbya sp. FACHB-261]
MGHEPIILGIVGDSAAGKTTITSGIAAILGSEDEVTVICTDDYHKYDRQQRAKLNISALHPDCNYLDIIEQHLALLKQGQPILKPIYNHSTGTFDPPEYIKPGRFVVVEGLLGYSTRRARDCFDVKVYLAPPESLRTKWKVKRDTGKRGYTTEQVLEQLRKREDDSEQFIRPQRQWSDMVVSFYPSSEADEEAGANLNVRLVLRPTLPHPDLSEVLRRSETASAPPAVRLTLDRDCNKPVDTLEIDGHVRDEKAYELMDLLCNSAPYGDRLRCCIDMGSFTGTTGEQLRSHPLALTQLLIAHHLLKAAHEVH